MKKRFLWWTAGVVAALLAATTFEYGQLPARIPMHWNAQGSVDGWGPRAGIFLHPAMLVVLALAWMVLPRISPRRFEVERFADTWWFAGMLVVGLLGYIQALLLWGVRSGSLHMPHALLGGVCLFIVLVGNLLGKVKRNFWLGVRTPWTLADERVWYATHRLAGKTMVAGGLLALGALLAGLPAQVATWLIIAGALVPAGYSLVYYKRLERAGGV